MNIGLQRQTCFYKDCFGRHPVTEIDSATEVLLRDFPFPAVGSLIIRIVEFKLMAGQKKLLFPDSLLFQKVFQHCLKSRNYLFFFNFIEIDGH